LNRSSTLRNSSPDCRRLGLRTSTGECGCSKAAPAETLARRQDRCRHASNRGSILRLVAGQFVFSRKGEVSTTVPNQHTCSVASQSCFLEDSSFVARHWIDTRPIRRLKAWPPFPRATQVSGCARPGKES
jgi:hypothetical protein